MVEDDDQAKVNSSDLDQNTPPFWNSLVDQHKAIVNIFLRCFLVDFLQEGLEPRCNIMKMIQVRQMTVEGQTRKRPERPASPYPNNWKDKESVIADASDINNHDNERHLPARVDQREKLTPMPESLHPLLVEESRNKMNDGM